MLLHNYTFCAYVAGYRLDQKATVILLSAFLQENALKLRANQYSKGMHQKVGIAITKFKNVDNWFFGEPTSGLDLKLSNEFTSLLKDLTSQKVANLMTGHNLFRAKETATHFGIMKEEITQMRSKIVSRLIGRLIPSMHSQLITNKLAYSGLGNYLSHINALAQFHEDKRLYFYPKILEGKGVNIENRDSLGMEYLSDTQKVNILSILQFLLITLILLAGTRYQSARLEGLSKI